MHMGAGNRPVADRVPLAAPLVPLVLPLAVTSAVPLAWWARGAAGGGPYARAETWRSELGSTVEGARRPEVPGGECSEAREARRSGMPEGCQR